MAAIKSHTDLPQSKVLSKFLPLESADMLYQSVEDEYGNGEWESIPRNNSLNIGYDDDIPCWSLAALLELIPKHILRKDKIHYGQTFIPSFRWEITPTAIYYTDGNNIMDYVSFRYGENNIELIDAVFKMIVWLKEKNLL